MCHVRNITIASIRVLTRRSLSPKGEKLLSALIDNAVNSNFI